MNFYDNAWAKKLLIFNWLSIMTEIREHVWKRINMRQRVPVVFPPCENLRFHFVKKSKNPLTIWNRQIIFILSLTFVIIFSYSPFQIFHIKKEEKRQAGNKKGRPKAISRSTLHNQTKRQLNNLEWRKRRAYSESETEAKDAWAQNWRIATAGRGATADRVTGIGATSVHTYRFFRRFLSTGLWRVFITAK